MKINVRYFAMDIPSTSISLYEEKVNKPNFESYLQSLKKKFEKAMVFGDGKNIEIFYKK